MEDVKPGERVYATVSGAGGASVGAVASSMQNQKGWQRGDCDGGGDGGEDELPEIFDNDNNTDEELKKKRKKEEQQQQRRSPLVPVDGTSLTANNLVSSAADLLFGPSVLSAATAKASDPSKAAEASPLPAAALFASSAALSEPDASQPAYRLRAIWAPARSSSASDSDSPPRSYLCPAGCSGRGACVADGECSCAPGSGGWRCQGTALDVSSGEGAAGRLPVGGWAFFRLPRSPAWGLTVRLDARGGGRPLLLARAGGPIGGRGAIDAPPAADATDRNENENRQPAPLTLQVASGTQLLRVSPEDSSADGGVVLALYNAPAGTHFAGSPFVFAVAGAGSASDAAAVALLEGGSPAGFSQGGGGRFPSLRGLGGLGPWAAVSVALAATALCAGLILIARAGVILACRRRAAATATAAAASATSALAAAADVDPETAAAIAVAEGGGAGAASGPGGSGPLGPGLSEEAISTLPTRRWEGAAAEKARRASGAGGGNGSAPAPVVHVVATAASAPPLSPSVSLSQVPPQQQQAQEQQRQQRLRRETDEKENLGGDLGGDPDDLDGDNGICCVVCCCEFVRGEELRILLPCRHEFHSSCVDAWLRGHASCPVCRRVPGSGSASASAAEATWTAAAAAQTRSSPPRPPPPPAS